MIRKELLDDGRSMRIMMPDKFDFHIHKELRDAYMSDQCQLYRIDMGQTNYMDSSALGMLLQVKEYAGDNAESVVIENANSNIKEILKVANFDQLMIVK